jgi:hypothetical protein
VRPPLNQALSERLEVHSDKAVSCHSDEWPSTVLCPSASCANRLARPNLNSGEHLLIDLKRSRHLDGNRNRERDRIVYWKTLVALSLDLHRD